MPVDAHNFAYSTKVAWERPAAEHNAIKRAERLGAVRVGPASTPDVWQFVPGDMPSSLWRFRDGSDYIIGDNGSWMQACRPRGQRKTGAVK